MKKLLSILLLAFYVLCAHAENLDSILNVLDKTVERRDTYFMAHEHAIDSVKATVAHMARDNSRAITDAYHHIFRLYRSYQGDSARSYAEREYAMATATGDPAMIVRAQTDRLDSRVNAGIFTEAVDIVRETDLRGVPPEARGNFYFICSRLYTDMSNYADGSFTDDNARLSKLYADSVIACLPPGSYRRMYSTIFKTLNDITTDQKLGIFNQLYRRPDIDNAEKAMIASVIADIYTSKNMPEMSAFYKAQSAILDIRSAKRETTSKNDLARMMFERGDIRRAIRYIELALEDARFFNARHRMGEISKVLPLIEHARYLNMADQRSTFRSLSLWMIAIALLLTGIVIYIVYQKRKLSRAKQLLSARNSEIEEANSQLEALNQSMNETNMRLQESNHIKDEYIGYGFSANSEYVNKLENLYKTVKVKLKVRQYADLETMLKDSDIRKEKEAMKQNFDKVFLRLFPTFIADYRKLFPADDNTFDEIDGHSLTPEMRIFALIRLGITDCNDIARFLNYSINTINTYKTKAKNRSTVPNEEFEAHIMEIRSVA